MGSIAYRNDLQSEGSRPSRFIACGRQPPRSRRQMSGDSSGRLRLAWQAGLFVPLVDAITAAELIRVLAYPKFKLRASAQHDLLADYLPWTQTIALADPPPRTPRCRDPQDVPFLQLAITARADALVTGDADLLALMSLTALPMLTPAQAIEALSARSPENAI